VLALAAVTPLVLLWLLLSGRTSIAIMLAAFVLPVFVEGARRWRSLLQPLGIFRNLRLTKAAAGAIDPMLADQCTALLRAYLQQTGQRVEHRPSKQHFLNTAANMPANDTGCERMSTEETFEVLGLNPTAGSIEIREAHRRLEERLDPGNGGTCYLVMKIREARDILLGV
jgi:hypothetical protein